MTPDTLDKLTRLAQQIDDLTKQVSDLDASDEQTREIIAGIRLSLDKLIIVVFGHSEYRLEGTADRLARLEKIVEEIIDTRRSERDKLKGIQIGLAITGVTGAGTLATVITQIIGG